MRLMLKFTIPAHAGNEAIEDGDMGKAIDKLLEQTNPEAAYFMVLDGERAGLIFFECEDQADLPTFNEPMFAALEAEIDIVPALTIEDLRRGLAKLGN
jgi:hypothetical protein